MAPARGHGTLRWHRLDIADAEGLAKLLADEGVDAVVHFAGLKAVGESVAQPVRYYRVNVGGTASLLQAMDDTGCAGWCSRRRARSTATPSASPSTSRPAVGAATPTAAPS